MFSLWKYLKSLKVEKLYTYYIFDLFAMHIMFAKFTFAEKNEMNRKYCVHKLYNINALNINVKHSVRRLFLQTETLFYLPNNLCVGVLREDS